VVLSGWGLKKDGQVKLNTIRLFNNSCDMVGSRRQGIKNRVLNGVVLIALLVIGCTGALKAQLPWSSESRIDQLLDNNWLTAADSTGGQRYDGFERLSYQPHDWQRVNLPHNWDDYGGYIRKKHGNRHGDAWYRKYFDAAYDTTKSSFLFFEGVSSYATLYLNGHLIGRHSGGRTSFSVEVSDYLNKSGKENLLAVYVQHPSGIRDLPWVCGGCSDEIGFSEGSQPMGIFRPVHLIQTGKVRIVPFGVHVYNDTTVSENAATLFVETSIKNNCKTPQGVLVRQCLLDKKGRQVAFNEQISRVADAEVKLSGRLNLTGNVHLWSLESPYLYQLKTSIIDKESGKLIDELTTPYGIRWIKWPDLKGAGPKQFLLNGKPVFINGIAGYEHALGKSHAFTDQEIATRVAMIKAMGFNAFRDAHQPHNLRFQYYWDHEGMLWWPQFSAHIWFDSPAFRKNFLALLRDWVLERRNSPSNIMWGLQNESKLPADFARECVALIRSLDPTASGQRLITTCNGGEGTDWNVPQNWSGTYGGDPDTYSEDLKKEVLVGEYGGWRTLDVHTEGDFDQKGPYSIESWCALLEKKIRLAANVKDSVCGQFLWLFNSHDNPGREQAAEGFRSLDRIGPVNYKGVLTEWEEPTEAFYLYAANFTSAEVAPVVHIASHDWAERWTDTSQKKDITVYSNCDSVLLYNGKGGRFLGTRMRSGIGTHFNWQDISLRYNELYAVGYFRGGPVVSDQVHLNNLPAFPSSLKKKAVRTESEALKPDKGYHYLYRYNCGGPAYLDHYGNRWSADRGITDTTKGAQFGSLSWTADYKGLPAYFASQRSITDLIEGTSDDGLFQSFRYGREKLRFVFPVKNGRYKVQLFFVEPWWGMGTTINCNGWRDFDVAINGKIVLPHLDIFKEAGSLRVLKKEVTVDVSQGQILINFPNTYSGQAVIAAIAIAKDSTGFSAEANTDADANRYLGTAPAPILQSVVVPGGATALMVEKNRKGVESGDRPFFTVSDWLAVGDNLSLSSTYAKKGRVRALDVMRVHIHSLPSGLYGAQYLNLHKAAYAPFVKHKEAAGNIYKWHAAADLNVYLGAQLTDSLLTGRLEKLGFVKTGDRVAIIYQKAGATMVDSLIIWQKDLKVGDEIREDAWWTSCLIAFKPVSQMQPPYDQKPEFTFGVHDASYSNEAKLVVRDQKDCLVFNGAGQQQLSWPVITGVADFHSFQVKYAHEGKDSLPATLSLLAADGSVMATKDIYLTATRVGKWNSCSLVTPTMINAGHYTLKISWQQKGKAAANQAVYMYNMKLR